MIKDHDNTVKYIINK